MHNYDGYVQEEVPQIDDTKPKAHVGDRVLFRLPPRTVLKPDVVTLRMADVVVGTNGFGEATLHVLLGFGDAECVKAFGQGNIEHNSFTVNATYGHSVGQWRGMNEGEGLVGGGRVDGTAPPVLERPATHIQPPTWAVTPDGKLYLTAMRRVPVGLVEEALDQTWKWSFDTAAGFAPSRQQAVACVERASKWPASEVALRAVALQVGASMLAWSEQPLTESQTRLLEGLKQNPHSGGINGTRDREFEGESDGTALPPMPASLTLSPPKPPAPTADTIATAWEFDTGANQYVRRALRKTGVSWPLVGVKTEAEKPMADQLLGGAGWVLVNVPPLEPWATVSNSPIFYRCVQGDGLRQGVLEVTATSAGASWEAHDGNGGKLYGECPTVQGAQKAAEAAHIQIAIQRAWRVYDAAVKVKAGPIVHEVSTENALVREGTEAFDVLMRTWLQNFEAPVWLEGETGLDGKVVSTTTVERSTNNVGEAKTPQPDRRNAIMGLFAGYDRAASAYIRSRGGLAGACIDSIVRQSLVPPEEGVPLGKRVAMNMVNIATTAAIPLDKLLEKNLLMNIDTDPNAPPKGPIAADVIDFDFNKPNPE